MLTVVDKQKILDLSKTISTLLKNDFVCRVLHAFVCRHFLFNMLTDKLDIHTNSRMNRNMKKKYENMHVKMFSLWLFTHWADLS